MLRRKKDLIKTDEHFSDFSGPMVRFLIKIDDSGVDFHRISSSGFVKAS